MRPKILSAIEAAVAVGVGTVIVPMLKDVLPLLPLWLWQLISMVIVYVAITIVALATWQRPVITVVWKSAEAGTPPLQDLRVQLDSATGVSERYQVAFSGQPKGFVTEWLMTWLRRHGLRLRFDPQGATAHVVLGRTSLDADRFPLGSSDYFDGFQMRVVTPPQPDTWMIANLNFQGRETMNQHPFTAVYDATADEKLPRRLAGRLVRVESHTKRLWFY